jgi:hypothetical protein
MTDTVLQFHLPPVNAGQIVLVSYAAANGWVIERTYDQSDRSTGYRISKALADDEGDYWNGEPANRRWRKLTAAEMKRYGLE